MDKLAGYNSVYNTPNLRKLIQHCGKASVSYPVF